MPKRGPVAMSLVEPMPSQICCVVSENASARVAMAATGPRQGRNPQGERTLQERRCRPSDFAALRRLPLFAVADVDDLAPLRPHLSIRTCSASTILWERDAPAELCVVLLKGQIHLLGPADSVMDVVTGPAVVGETAVFDPAGYPWRARALGGSRMILIPAAAWCETLRQSPLLRQNLLAVMSARQAELRQEVWDLRHLPPGLRLAGLLLEMGEPGPGGKAETDQSPRLWPAVPRRVVASRLGMRAESLSRALNRLSSFGVAREGDSITVTDPVALKDYFSRGRAQKPNRQLVA